MKSLTPRSIWIMIAVVSAASLILASFATVMVLLPTNNATVNLASECTLGTSNIARSADSVPAPLAAPFSPQNRTFYLQTMEVCAEIEAGTSYQYWTFNGTVPGPMLRVRQGDNVTVTIHNAASSLNTHSIDLHAVIGPGGGMLPTQTLPGGTTKFWFNALHPGLYVYHCATPPADSHIANGMYGMILVEPPGGLPAAKEFYIMQGEFYSNAAKGTTGHHAFSSSKMITGIPDYVTFNGRVGALTGTGALSVPTNQLVRIYFGVGGPNLDSSFHIIGEIFDTVYLFGTTDTNSQIQNVQTVSVPPGGSTIVEFTPLVPSSQAYGSYTIVDHSLSWALQKGAAGTLTVTGTATPGVFGT